MSHLSGRDISSLRDLLWAGLLSFYDIFRHNQSLHQKKMLKPPAKACGFYPPRVKTIKLGRKKIKNSR
jgi:hypothetical protein